MRLSDPTTYAVMARKLGEARRIINEYWTRTRKDDPTKPYDRDWAMHVALVELANLLRKDGGDHDAAGVGGKKCSCGSTTNFHTRDCSCLPAGYDPQGDR